MYSKFYGIKFPIFTLQKRPIKLVYEKNYIIIQKDIDSNEIILNKELFTRNYYESLLKSSDIEVDFDYTCNNLSQLINSKSKWGIDVNNNIFDLSKKETFLLSYRNINKIDTQNNILWLNKISYPMKFNYSYMMDNITNLNEYYSWIVNIDKIWVIYKFSMNIPKNKVIKL